MRDRLSLIVAHTIQVLTSGRRGLKNDLALQKDKTRFQRLVVDYEDNEVSVLLSLVDALANFRTVR